MTSWEEHLVLDMWEAGFDPWRHGRLLWYVTSLKAGPGPRCMGGGAWARDIMGGGARPMTVGAGRPGVPGCECE